MFTFYIPAVPDALVERKMEQGKLQHGCGMVLLMDDDEVVRTVAAEMLKYLGYDVTTASHGQETLDLFEKARLAGRTYDVVIMDLTIPGGMGGKETLEKLRAVNPAVRAIVSSGYANDPVMANYKEYGFAGAVPKPFKIEELSSVLKRLYR